MNRKSSDVHPPFAAIWLVDQFVDDRHRESVLGDLSEEFVESCRGSGVAAARRSYWRLAISTIVHLVWSSARLAPWSTATLVFLGLMSIGLADLTIRSAVQALLVEFNPYDHVSATFFWRAVQLIRFVLVPLSLGWVIARVAGEREMVVTSMMAAALIAILGWNLMILAARVLPAGGGLFALVWRTPLVVDLIQIGTIAPVALLIGGLVRRQRRAKRLVTA